jgi:hypothetical protein
MDIEAAISRSARSRNHEVFARAMRRTAPDDWARYARQQASIGRAITRARRRNRTEGGAAALVLRLTGRKADRAGRPAGWSKSAWRMLRLQRGVSEFVGNEEAKHVV